MNVTFGLCSLCEKMSPQKKIKKHYCETNRSFISLKNLTINTDKNNVLKIIHLLYKRFQLGLTVIIITDILR